MVPPAVVPVPAPARRLAPDARRSLRRAVLAWYTVHGRRLEFRRDGRPDPWGVLVSEVMAQQTQISRVEERWPSFMAAFPTPATMAATTPAEVIRAWRGLGYNRRARDLHRAAVEITTAGGFMPDDLDALRALPGVGPYTARAVAAIAFGKPVAAVDVNVRRVVGRIVAGDAAALAPAALQRAADELVDPRRPGTWTHAVMDLGATTCRSDRPVCPACPARPWCAAAASDAFNDIAVRPSRPSSGAALVPFEQSMRWLRGRIVDRLRDAPAGAPITIAGPIGPHSEDAVRAALEALAGEGMIELTGPAAACLPR